MGACGHTKNNAGGPGQGAGALQHQNLKVKLLTLALLASMLIHKPASALIVVSDSTSTRNLDNSINFDSLEDNLRKPQVARRTLLQDGRFRPTPTGYPPPGDNAQVVPRAPSFTRRPP